MTRQSVMPKRTSSSLSSGLLQRKCTACGQQASMGKECSLCQDKKLKSLHRSMNRKVSEYYTDKSTSSKVPQIVYEVLNSPGHSLQPDTRAFMESRFKHDFGQVRVHTDAKAAKSASAVDARAYTVRNSIVFGEGQYQPNTVNGKRLIAHELTHTIQQRSGLQLTPGILEITHPDHSTELEAEDATERVFSKHSLSSIQNRQTQLARWAISGNIATSDRASDRLGLLAQQLKSVPQSWVCIKPVNMQTANNPNPPSDFDLNYERYVQLGDTFDVSNLQAVGGGNSLRINFHPERDIQTLAESRFYPGLKKLANDPDAEISASSQQGKAPLSELIMLAHGIGDYLSGNSFTFKPKSFAPDLPIPSYKRANAGELPRRCWFTLDAQARAVGCETGRFGRDFASVYLRQGAKIVSTIRSIAPTCTKDAKNSPDSSECKYIDAMEFKPADREEVINPSEHGPFIDAQTFHASPFWVEFPGRL